MSPLIDQLMSICLLDQLVLIYLSYGEAVDNELCLSDYTIMFWIEAVLRPGGGWMGRAYNLCDTVCSIEQGRMK